MRYILRVLLCLSLTTLQHVGRVPHHFQVSSPTLYHSNSLCKFLLLHLCLCGSGYALSSLAMALICMSRTRAMANGP